MDSDTNIASDKSLQRDHFLALRATLSAPERLRQSRMICERILALPELEGKTDLHLFWPMLGRGEVDLRPAIDAWVLRGGRVAMPVTVSTDPPTMIQRAFLGEERLEPARWGIMEPDRNCPEVPRDEIDAFVVPAVAATQRGERLGYGGGFYDSFLSENRAPVIIPLFECCLTSELPLEAHDQRADIVIMPSTTIRTATSVPR